MLFWLRLYVKLMLEHLDSVIMHEYIHKLVYKEVSPERPCLTSNRMSGVLFCDHTSVLLDQRVKIKNIKMPEVNA